MTMWKQDLLATVAGTALALSAASWPTAALAADEKAGPTPQAATESLQDEDIVVTTSRVSGFTAPTPLTVLSVDDLNNQAITTIGQLAASVPSFYSAQTPTTTVLSAGSAGGNYFNLRALGEVRTLVLVDGRRHVPTSPDGWVDTNVIPKALVNRVEVVTGGASAAWGSDAVAGVVNIVFDKSFTGLKGDIQGGISERGDNKEVSGSLAFGTKFADGRGYFVVAAEGMKNSGVLHQYLRDWTKDYQLIPNPSYTPGTGQFQRLIVPNGRFALASEGGLIFSGPLFGQQFLPGGQLAPFQFGTNFSPPYMQGGDGLNLGRANALSAPLDRANVFTRLSFDISPKTRIFGEASAARSHSSLDLVASFDFASLFILADNAYLPTAAKSALTAAGEPGFAMGRYNTDIGYIRPNNTNTTLRFVAGAEGEFGNGWKWDAYAQFGQTKYAHRAENNRIEANYALAVDAVVNPATNQIVCRSTLANPGNGCVPINLFGKGSPSAAAIAYVTGTERQDLTLKQTVVAGNVRGTLGETWAGPVKFATGLEYRRESVGSTVDSISASNGFIIGNPKAISGGYSVREGYAEVVIPLLKDTAVARRLDLDAAVRLTDYSTSGQVTTWKAGLSWEVVGGLRLRATRSRDIRAPNLNELYTGAQVNFTQAVDPTNGQTVILQQTTTGNTKLDPEKADTFTAGVVLQPGWARGLRLSADYYNIEVRGAISTLGAQDLINRCAAGNAALCSFVNRTPAGVLSGVTLAFINLSKIRVSGVDVELSETFGLKGIAESLPGTMSLRLRGTYVDKLVYDDGVTAIDRVGDLGTDVQVDRNTGLPRYRINASATYAAGPATVFLEGRFISSGKYDHTFGPEGINDNTIPSRFYLNLSGSFALIDKGERKLELFGAVHNLLDKDPPVNPGSFIAPRATNAALYDVIGRTFTMGVRFRY